MKKEDFTSSLSNNMDTLGKQTIKFEFDQCAKD